MVEFWKSTPGKAILRQISNIPENSDSDSDSDNNVLTFSDEDLILSKSILTSFLEDIRDLLGRALWFLFNKTVTENKPFPTTGQTWTRFRHLDFPVSKEHQGLLSVAIDGHEGVGDGGVVARLERGGRIGQADVEAVEGGDGDEAPPTLRDVQLRRIHHSGLHTVAGTPQDLASVAVLGVAS